MFDKILFIFVSVYVSERGCGSKRDKWKINDSMTDDENAIHGCLCVWLETCSPPASVTL